ncbi:uncharacterized protein LOC144152620 [Haemaphysalis longicornis]
MTAWFFANTALNIALLYGVEAYPTPVRCLGYCISTGVGMLGTVAGPVITASVKQYGNEVPYMVMAIGCLASGIVTLFLPETRARKLPEVAEQHGNIFEFLPFHKMNQSEIEHQRKQRRSLSVHSHRLRDGARPITGGLDKPAATDATERLGPIRADTLAGTAAPRVQASGTTAESGQVDPGEIMSARQHEGSELAKDEIPPALTQPPPSGISPRSPASPEILCSPSVGSSGSPPGSPDAASDPRSTTVVGTTTNAPSYMRDSETIVLGERRTSTVAGATRSKKAARKHSTHGGHGSRSAAAKPRKTV